jgi:hypothetical protein
VSSPSNATTYKVLNLAAGIVGGALAGAVFARLWRVISNGDDAVPQPTRLDHGLRDVLLAGMLHGALSGLVKAVLARVTAKGYLRLTGDELTR